MKEEVMGGWKAKLVVGGAYMNYIVKCSHFAFRI